MQWGRGEIADLMESSNNNSLDVALKLEGNHPGN